MSAAACLLEAVWESVRSSESKAGRRSTSSSPPTAQTRQHRKMRLMCSPSRVLFIGAHGLKETAIEQGRGGADLAHSLSGHSWPQVQPTEHAYCQAPAPGRLACLLKAHGCRGRPVPDSSMAPTLSCQTLQPQPGITGRQQAWCLALWGNMTSRRGCHCKVQCPDLTWCCPACAECTCRSTASEQLPPVGAWSAATSRLQGPSPALSQTHG